MLSVSRNVFASIFARIWSGVMQFAFTPVYVALLKPEAYGLVGIYSTLLVSTLFLDQCVSPVLARELGRLGSREGTASEMRNLLRSLEVLSLATGSLVGVMVYLAAPYIGGHWINAGGLPRDEVTSALRLMGLVIACQWPNNLYCAGFIGLHRQDQATNLRILFTTLQWAGAAVLLWGVAPSITLLLSWQAANFALFSAMLARRLWRLMPKASASPRFDGRKLRSVGRFALGTLVIGMLASLLTQADKLLVSKYIPLDQFAAYSLAFTLASPITLLVAQPVGSALMPHFSRLISGGDRSGLAREYHRWAQTISVLALPMAGALATFGKPLTMLWLGRGSPLVDPLAILLPWVAAGTLVNTVLMTPYVLQIAAGWTRLAIFKNVVALTLFLPTLVIGVPRFGPLMGVWGWLAVNLGCYLIEAPLMHRRLLTGELGAWWGRDTLLPMVVTALLFGGSGLLAAPDQSVWSGLAQATSTAGLVLAVLVALLPYPRAQAGALLRRLAAAR
ncbi:lipopolysaccharide biosynthesis protein [Telmatospirillum siberiense]|uniref:Polysaccharide biosynthesis protein n=1 Tax=Telmatospirillum siberiense TaxID=382514 RepID=A0A2N3PSZ7_9PROT|nr:oligosaccharide flippase family protein [Telmatospirillum siberiense]PKU23529.1 hypothetical protein CWS72_15780 [Telmatospirillum siberiense]